MSERLLLYEFRRLHQHTMHWITWRVLLHKVVYLPLRDSREKQSYSIDDDYNRSTHERDELSTVIKSITATSALHTASTQSTQHALYTCIIADLVCHGPLPLKTEWRDSRTNWCSQNVVLWYCIDHHWPYTVSNVEISTSEAYFSGSGGRFRFKFSVCKLLSVSWCSHILKLRPHADAVHL